MVNGIICFESGEFKSHLTKDEFYARPLLEFLEKTHTVQTIYRNIATLHELQFYFEKIGNKKFHNEYQAVYLSFHGAPQSINLKGSGNISLEAIAEEAAATDAFTNRHVHFSSCHTLDCDERIIRDFKRTTGAKSVSGYTKVVDTVSAYINELAYFDQLIRYETGATVKKHMADYQSQLNKLGFCIY